MTAFSQLWDTSRPLRIPDVTNDDVTPDTPALQFDLSGTDAKYFSINQNQFPEPDNTAGLIRTNGALDFETKSTYTVTVTATDPAGLAETVRVTINVVDVPEIQGLAQRIRVDENTKKIADLYNSYATKTGLGGLKWSLLTDNEENIDTPMHNRTNPDSVDCQVDPDNEGLCDDFRFSRNNTSQTTLQFAIGTGEKHDAPNFEKPADEEDDTVIPPILAGDNVYKIVVRVAFANLRSYGADNDPSPAADESHDIPVSIRVDDVDESPKFADDASTRLVTEDSDDILPSIDMNRLVVGTVRATDPEYGYMDGPQYGKKLTYSLSLPEAYSNLFQIVPSNGDILTRARLNYEALSELEEMGPDGGQHRIITVPRVGPRVTATDSAMPMGNSDDIGADIRVNDVNETPIPVADLSISGDATVDRAEDETDTTVGTYTVFGDNAATAAWSLGGADRALFDLDDDGREATLKFKSVPDFEMPRGQAVSATNTNEYMVTIQARHDADDTFTKDVAITVTNVEEDGTVTLNPTRPIVGMPITATVTDLDIVDENTVSWQWASSDTADGTYANINSATSATYTPVDADANMWLRAMATYTDGKDSGNVEMAVSASAVSQVAVNVAPSFGEGASTTRTIAEDAEPNTNIGAPVVAIDPNGPTPTYSLAGTDAVSFGIAVSTGQLRTSAALDFETKSTYSVEVTATDLGRLSDTIDVTINVTDVVEEDPVDPVARYDADRNQMISLDEALQAVEDFFDPAVSLSLSDVLEVIDAFFNP